MTAFLRLLESVADDRAATVSSGSALQQTVRFKWRRRHSIVNEQTRALSPAAAKQVLLNAAHSIARLGSIKGMKRLTMGLAVKKHPDESPAAQLFRSLDT